MKTICFIPARYQSSRLPGKPLLKINNKTIINLVYEQVQKCSLIDNIIILTDDDRIKNEVDLFGGNCVVISENCVNGTERIVKFIKQSNIEVDLIVNVQGDEPYINPIHIDKCIENYLEKKNLLKSIDIKCGTLHFEYKDISEVEKRSNGKIVLDKYNNILYCSRNIIPGFKKSGINKGHVYYGHIGVFVFDKNYLINEYLNGYSPNQLAEDIEWLKILEDGYKITSVLVCDHEIGVDTYDDYNYLYNKYR